MTDTAAHDSDSVAHSVFAGLVPKARAAVPAPERTRIARGIHATVPIILVGSMAAMTLNLTGPIDAANAKRLPKPKAAATDSGKSLKETAPASVIAAMPAVTTAPPASYRVIAGDTVSDIAGRYGLSTASILALNGLGWSSLIFPGQELKLTTSGPATPVEPAEATPSGRYTIVAGDTISDIADRFGVSTISLLSANGLGWASIIYPGQTLAIPGLVGPGTPPESADPAPDEPQAPVQEVPVVEAAPVEPAPAPVAPIVEAPTAPSAITYTIVSGDTLSGIAAKFGITMQSLMDANGLDSSSLIFAGHTLQIPGATSIASYDGSVEGLDAEMAAHVSTIIQVGRELGVPDYGIIIAIATAMQESSLRNLDWGDRDSVGLFQQRPSSGWGSVEQLTTPSYAARLFYGGPSNPNRGYTRGLLDIPGWQNMTLTQAAQAVQISAYPDAYAKWEASARDWFSQLG